MKKILFDELDFLNKFGDEDIDCAELLDEELDCKFNNEWARKQYVLCGSVGLWNGTTFGYYPNVLSSIKEAIDIASSEFGMCYISVYEAEYGKLFIDVSHHDGHCHLEIREITKKGTDVLDLHCQDVGMIVNRKGCTKNAKYLKNCYC